MISSWSHGWNSSQSPLAAIATFPVVLVLHIMLFLLHRVLATIDGLFSKLFELCSRFIAIQTCGVYTPEESAVVIVGGDSDIGKHVALKFSKLGYTVFALCRPQPNGSPGIPPDNMSNVTWLLYEWHKQRKQSGHSTIWGVVAPIALDTQSTSQRAHAFETIHAYCATHSLHLVTVIFLPPRGAPLAREWNPSLRERAIDERDRYPPPRRVQGFEGIFRKVTTWEDFVSNSIIEPVLVVQSCVDMLLASSGRVILVPECQDGNLLSRGGLSPLEGIYQFVAQYLRDELQHLGVRVSTISTGPMVDSVRVAAGVSSSRPTAFRTQTVTPSLRRKLVRLLDATLEEVLERFSVQEHDLSYLLENITASSYPKDRYTLGIHPFLFAAEQASPQALKLVARWLWYS